MFGRANITQMNDITKLTKGCRSVLNKYNKNCFINYHSCTKPMTVYKTSFFTTSSFYRTQSIRSFDDEKKYRPYIAPLKVHICDRANRGQQSYTDNLKKRCHSELY